MNNYEIFDGELLQIADLIQRRRLQLLVHSCIYYELNKNVVSDKVWDSWARQLVDLQSKYPDVSKQVIWYEAFKDWDASTGAFLPIKDKWVMQKATYIMKICHVGGIAKEVIAVKKQPAKAVKKSKKPMKRGLF